MRAALVATLAVGSSCAAGRAGGSRSGAAPEHFEAEQPSAAVSGPVILVTIDGARWQEIFEGTDAQLTSAPWAHRSPRDLVPNLDRLVRERGAAVGAPGQGVIRATGPNFVSLPGYTEILTGRAPITCQDNSCATITVPTLLDETHAAGGAVAAFGSWEMLDRAVSSRPGSFVVSCGRNGDPNIDPWPGSGGFRPDRLTAQKALEHLETARPDLLYVGLGEPDEYGHHDDYAGYLRALTFADGVIGRLLAVLDRMGPRGQATHLFVTADHGRARDFKGHGGSAPESARVWLIATGPSIAARGRVASSHERHLADVAPTLRTLLGLSRHRERVRDREGARSEGWPGEPLDELFAANP